jgi:hypothetical protein
LTVPVIEAIEELTSAPVAVSTSAKRKPVGQIRGLLDSRDCAMITLPLPGTRSPSRRYKWLPAGRPDRK